MGTIGKVTELAPAKVNFCLHVGPLRADGLHDLFSLVVFAGCGDVITVEDSDTLSLDIIGPFAPALASFPVEENLVYQAALKLLEASGVQRGARITLEKNLPVAAGIGGGSADAAAALRALTRLWSIGMSDIALGDLAFSLGADVPACIINRPLTVHGAGEKLAPGPVLSPYWLCLVNPGEALPTGPVFRQFDQQNPNPAKPVPVHMIRLISAEDYERFFFRTRNDLEGPATELRPVIKEVLSVIGEAPGAVAARMSGSGATCFGVFSSLAAAERCAAAAHGHGWWSQVGRLLQ